MAPGKEKMYKRNKNPFKNINKTRNFFFKASTKMQKRINPGVRSMEQMHKEGAISPTFSWCTCNEAPRTVELHWVCTPRDNKTAQENRLELHCNAWVYYGMRTWGWVFQLISNVEWARGSDIPTFEFNYVIMWWSSNCGSMWVYVIPQRLY